ncbi:P49 [Urbanus proteus nucleopolyhedrovirus]|uniref:P49 n=1 Tax=Urbanus proteus nucleopolyhedrovirus TaxID=1675866 RepID=A0A162GTL7_9ABAC|nr:P49 [Urbanus proteus nucleopolyhedrovirus]AKR17278.1 P49 [Urbanus proteus nucleopolyhedrovirus]
MSIALAKHTLEPKDYKYLFIASYFQLLNNERFSDNSEPFIANYLRNKLDVLDENSLLKFIDYLNDIGLKFLINDRSLDVFKFVKPQFKYVNVKKNVDILRLERTAYIRSNVPIYATNLFVSNPKNFQLLLYKEFSHVVPNRELTNVGENYCLLNGEIGYVFDNPYVDWQSTQLCIKSNNVSDNNANIYNQRLYLVGEEMAKHFIINNIDFTTITNEFIYKNFYKGLPLYKTYFKVINSKKFTTKKINVVFDEIRTELDEMSTYVKFIQRDYIFDADRFPEDLLDLLSNYMTDTSLCKFITKFDDSINNERSAGKESLFSEIVLDRYAVNKYRKLNIKIDPFNKFPSLSYNDLSYIFVRPDILQLKGTLNSFYVPQERLLVILSNNSLFGSTVLLHFDYSLLPYRQSVPPQRLQKDSYVVNSSQKIYLTEHIFGNYVPAYLLIRGDYESSFGFKNLNELNNSWVLNTIFKLLIPDTNSVAKK